jgi:hypothetical protein
MLTLVSSVLYIGVLSPGDVAVTEDEEPEEEVVVRGQRPVTEVSHREISKEDIVTSPGSNGDPVRVMENLPGIARPPFPSNQLSIRGSAPNDSLVLLDGTPIPLALHLGSLTSVVPAEVVDRVQLFPGNFGAQYGRAIGGVMELGLRSGGNAPRAVSQADGFDARLLVEGPIGDTGWTFLAAARRSYLDAWLTPVLRLLRSQLPLPVYEDAQLSVTRAVPGGSLRILGFFSQDEVSLPPGSPLIVNTRGASAEIIFWRLQAIYDQQLTDAIQLRVNLAGGQDFTLVKADPDQRALNNIPLSLRADCVQRLAWFWSLHAGLDLAETRYRLDANQGGDTMASSGLVTRPAAFLDSTFAPWAGTHVVPGLRVDYTHDTNRIDVSPRFNVGQELPWKVFRTTLRAGLGLYYQPPVIDGVTQAARPDRLTSSRAVHGELGINQQLRSFLAVEVTGFYKRLTALRTPAGPNAGDGDAFGLETLLSLELPNRVAAAVSYTLSRSELRDQSGEALHLSPYDETHILTAVASYRLPGDWQVGLRFRLTSGSPYTPWGSTELYSQRLPLFHQLDLRVDKAFHVSRFKIVTYLDLENAYSARVAQSTTFDSSGQQFYQYGLPIVPSFGMRIEHQ